MLALRTLHKCQQLLNGSLSNATSSINIALLPGDYVLEIEGKTIETISKKINIPNGPGKKIDNMKIDVKLKK